LQQQPPIQFKQQIIPRYSLSQETPVVAEKEFQIDEQHLRLNTNETHKISARAPLQVLDMGVANRSITQGRSDIDGLVSASVRIPEKSSEIVLDIDIPNRSLLNKSSSVQEKNTLDGSVGMRVVNSSNAEEQQDRLGFPEPKERQLQSVDKFVTTMRQANAEIRIVESTSEQQDISSIYNRSTNSNISASKEIELPMQDLADDDVSIDFIIERNEANAKESNALQVEVESSVSESSSERSASPSPHSASADESIVNPNIININDQATQEEDVVVVAASIEADEMESPTAHDYAQ
jgi:hypothetical protein